MSDLEKMPETVNQETGKENERGASLVEYALLVALIAVIAIVAIKALGTKISTQFSNVSGQI